MTDYFRNSELHVFRISVVQNKKNYEIRVLLSIIDNVLTARVTIVKRTLLMFFKSTNIDKHIDIDKRSRYC